MRITHGYTHPLTCKTHTTVVFAISCVIISCVFSHHPSLSWFIPLSLSWLCLPSFDSGADVFSSALRKYAPRNPNPLQTHILGPRGARTVSLVPSTSQSTLGSVRTKQSPMVFSICSGASAQKVSNLFKSEHVARTCHHSQAQCVSFPLAWLCFSLVLSLSLSFGRSASSSRSRSLAVSRSFSRAFSYSVSLTVCLSLSVSLSLSLFLFCCFIFFLSCHT